MRGGVKRQKAIVRNVVEALLANGEIVTTEAQARLARVKLDRLVSQAKEGTLHSRRLILSFVENKKLVNKLVDEIAPQFKNRTSGFTRVVKMGRRLGDRAMMAKIEFVELMKSQQVETKAEEEVRSKRRSLKKKEEVKEK